MRKLATGALVLVLMSAASGCFARGGFRGPSPFGLLATAVTVAAVTAALTAPPVAVEVEYYDYGARPGYVWVNPQYVQVDGDWEWRPGYWQADRPGFYWVQGAWEPRGDQYVWVDGYWASPRTGYVFVDGYWDWRDSGYVWLPGRWEVERPGYVFVGGGWSTYGDHRVWVRGGWQRDDGRVAWARYRRR
jgi:hypothetical protein